MPGHGGLPSPKCWRTPATASRCGPVGPNWPTRSTAPIASADYLDARACPSRSAPPATTPKRSTGACTVLLAVPSQTLRGQSRTRWKDAIGRRRHPGEPGQGHRAGHADADESGRSSRSPVPTRSRVAVVTGPNLASEIARGTARRHRRRLQRLRSGGDDSACAGHRLLPAIHQRRRDRRRGRRRVQERHRSRQWDGRGCRAGREHRGGDHHPGSGRDHAARNCVGGQARDAWPGSQASAIWWRRARRRTPATGPSANGWAKGGTMQAALAATGGHVAEGVTSCQIGAGAGIQLRRRDAAHRGGAPACVTGVCPSTTRWHCCSAAPPSRSRAGERHLRRFHPQRQSC